jgi:hypothetical protein
MEEGYQTPKVSGGVATPVFLETLTGGRTGASIEICTGHRALPAGSPWQLGGIMTSLHQTRRRTSYDIEDFLDDQRRLVRGTCVAKDTIVDELEGRLRVIDTERLEQALQSDSATETFHEKYGDEPDEAHCQRCRRVVTFLRQWHREIVRSGLAAGQGSSLAVREEFLEYLLRCSEDVTEPALSVNALTRFLDAWSHRWM